MTLIYQVCSTCIIAAKPAISTHAYAKLSRILPRASIVIIDIIALQPQYFAPLHVDPSTIYFLIDEARRSVGRLALLNSYGGDFKCHLLLNSDFLAFSSLTRLARMEAYSFCTTTISLCNLPKITHAGGKAYRSIFRSLSLTALQGHSVTLML